MIVFYSILIPPAKLAHAAFCVLIRKSLEPSFDVLKIYHDALSDMVLDGAFEVHSYNDTHGPTASLSLSAYDFTSIRI